MNDTRIPTALAAVRLGFFAALSLGVLAAQDVKKTADGQDPTAPKTLEAFEVTGSRVKRLDYETASPVVTFTAAAIEGATRLRAQPDGARGNVGVAAAQAAEMAWGLGGASAGTCHVVSPG